MCSAVSEISTKYKERLVDAWSFRALWFDSSRMRALSSAGQGGREADRNSGDRAAIHCVRVMIAGGFPASRKPGHSEGAPGVSCFAGASAAPGQRREADVE
eukprot:2367826-Pyramimonas_sp.AAC.1